MATKRISSDELASEARAAVIGEAASYGMLAGTRRPVGVRLPEGLIAAARRRSGAESLTELVEYALAKVALEDDFGPRLLAREGSISPDIDLEF
ncbi:hypothetical protein [Phenylobacterium sp.]|jgi:hypothetical protein|uniref:hypothetical protein n=1 Tax=Phenylobacterium sp. TaxID=1871053 RepID=UPI0037C7A142